VLKVTETSNVINFGLGCIGTNSTMIADDITQARRESSTDDHRSVKTGHPVLYPLISPSFTVTGSQRFVVCTLLLSDILRVNFLPSDDEADLWPADTYEDLSDFKVSRV
jgi:hypothetical protein